MDKLQSNMLKGIIVSAICLAPLPISAATPPTAKAAATVAQDDGKTVGGTVLDENGEPVMEEYTYPNYVTALFSMNADGSDLKRVGSYAPTAIPEGAQGGSWVSAFTAAVVLT